MTRREQTLILIIIMLILAGVVIYFTALNEKRTKEKIITITRESKYQIYAIDVPKNLSFAGEPVPEDDPYVIERIDREIHENAFRHSSTLLTIKKVKRYFPMFSRILKQHGIPDDFKYIAVAESDLKNVVSPAGAVGFWQFMEHTGKAYGLEINEKVDERLDPVKSTHAACKYFKDAYRKFGSWTLVAASYNRGIGGMERAMEHQKEKDFYDLRLNNETDRYVYRILALKEVISKPEKFGFSISKNQYYPEIKTKSVFVDTTITDLVVFANDFGVKYKTLRELNPWLNDIDLPNPNRKKYTILLPLEVDYDEETIKEDSI